MTLTVNSVHFAPILPGGVPRNDQGRTLAIAFRSRSAGDKAWQNLGRGKTDTDSSGKEGNSATGAERNASVRPPGGPKRGVRAPAGWTQAGCPRARGVSVSRRTAAGRPEGAESKACRFPGVASLAPARSPTPWQAGFSCRCNSCTTYRNWSRDTVARTVLARTATMALAYGQAPGRGLPGAANCG